jgi:hypothetical protein
LLSLSSLEGNNVLSGKTSYYFLVGGLFVEVLLFLFIAGGGEGRVWEFFPSLLVKMLFCYPSVFSVLGSKMVAR